MRRRACGVGIEDCKIWRLSVSHTTSLCHQEIQGSVR